tara:strand:+ start:1828 stop:2097 length:270 start_codon:yes stop_codon:yes gene_type:complete
MTVAGKHPWVSVVETLAGTYLQHEQIRNGIPLGYNGAPNTADAYPKVTTGVDYDGTTLRQIVPGVDNQQLAVGVGGLLVLGIVVYALTR